MAQVETTSSTTESVSEIWGGKSSYWLLCRKAKTRSKTTEDVKSKDERILDFRQVLTLTLCFPDSKSLRKGEGHRAQNLKRYSFSFV